MSQVLKSERDKSERAYAIRPDGACAGHFCQLRILGGAMSRVANDATAFAHCDKQAMVMVTHFGPLSADSTDLHARTLEDGCKDQPG